MKIVYQYIGGTMKEKESLKEAKKLFSKYGFKKVSMDEILKKQYMQILQVKKNY